MRTFTFNGIRSDSYFLTNSINRSILPSIELDSISIPNRHGSYATRSRLEEYEIEVEVTLLADSWNESRETYREIAAWLFTQEEKPLVLSDEPDKFYYARLVGDTDLDEVLAMGEGSLTFICSDPFAYSLIEKNRIWQTEFNLLPASGNFADISNADYWQAYHDKSLKKTFPDLPLTNGETKNFLRIDSVGGLAANQNFGVFSTEGFSIEAGKTYELSFLVAIHPNALPIPSWTWLVTRGNTEVENQQIITPEDSAITTFPLYASMSSEWELGFYRYTKRFVAQYTDSDTQLLIGGHTSKDLPTSSYGVMLVSDIVLEEVRTNLPQKIENEGTIETFPRIRVVPFESNIPYIRVQKGSSALVIYGPFRAWEPIIIDHNANLVYEEKTRKRLMNRVDISSDFFPLEIGENHLTLEPTEDVSARIYWRERFL